MQQLPSLLPVCKKPLQLPTHLPFFHAKLHLHLLPTLLCGLKSEDVLSVHDLWEPGEFRQEEQQQWFARVL